MKKWILIASLATMTSPKAQHTAGEWFITAGGRPPLQFHQLNYTLRGQTGFFVTSKVAFGVQFQLRKSGSFYKEVNYSLFSRYYFMNKEQVGFYGFASFGRSEVQYYYSGPQTHRYMSVGLGIGTDVTLTQNWRLNLEVNFLGGNFGTSLGTMGVSYSIPYRKAHRKKGVL